jgi:hypothetical protein
MLGFGLSPVSGMVLNRGVAGPSLDINFLTGALPGSVTFARTSTATRYNSSGVLETVASGVARFDHDPVTLQPRGLLIEEGRQNLAPGNMASGGFWAQVGAGVSFVSGAAAPDGTNNATTVTEGGTTSAYGLNLAAPPTITASSPITASLFVKAGTGTWLRLLLVDALTPTISVQAWFNLGTGAVGTVGIFTQSGGTPTAFSASIQPAPGGYWRCTLTATLAAATTAAIMLRMVSGDNVTSDTGGKTMVFFGPQLEAGAFATSWIPTTTAAASRANETATMTSIAGWYAADQGTALVEFDAPNQTRNPNTGVSFGFSDGTFNNSKYLSNGNATDTFIVVNGNVQQAAVSAGAAINGARKLAFAYRVNDFAACRSGGTVGTDTAGTLPTATQARIGCASWGAGGNQINGYVRKIQYWRTRRPNSELQSLTA